MLSNIFKIYRTGDIQKRESIVAQTVLELQQEGYKESDVLSVSAVYLWMKSQSYEAEVVFRDEPDARYYYFWNPNDSMIEQGGTSGGEKHRRF